MQETTTYIDILRHGQPEGPECLRGHVDPELTEIGWEQMRTAVRQRVPAREYDLIVSSDLRRCAEFATWLGQTRSLPLVMQPEFREMNFGEWDGIDLKFLWAQHARELGEYWHDPWNNTPHAGETMRDFASRIETAWDKLIKRHVGKRILLVTHAGIIRHLMARILHMPLPGTAHISALFVPYAALVSVEVRHGEGGCYWPRLCLPEVRVENAARK
jgi:broad specificity phosphatase PhoE